MKGVAMWSSAFARRWRGVLPTPRARVLGAVALLVIVGAMALRVHLIANVYDLTPDDGHIAMEAVQVANGEREPRVLTFPPDIGNHALQIHLMSLAFSAFGVNDVVARVPTMAGALLMLGGTFVLGWSLFSARAGLIALAVVGFARFSLYHSVDASAYSLLAGLHVAALLFVHEATARGLALARRAAVGGAAALLAFLATTAHELGPLFLAPLLLYAVARLAAVGADALRTAFPGGARDVRAALVARLGVWRRDGLLPTDLALLASAAALLAIAAWLAGFLVTLWVISPTPWDVPTLRLYLDAAATVQPAVSLWLLPAAAAVLLLRRRWGGLLLLLDVVIVFGLLLYVTSRQPDVRYLYYLFPSTVLLLVGALDEAIALALRAVARVRLRGLVRATEVAAVALVVLVGFSALYPAEETVCLVRGEPCYYGSNDEFALDGIEEMHRALAVVWAGEPVAAYHEGQTSFYFRYWLAREARDEWAVPASAMSGDLPVRGRDLFFHPFLDGRPIADAEVPAVFTVDVYPGTSYWERGEEIVLWQSGRFGYKLLYTPVQPAD